MEQIFQELWQAAKPFYVKGRAYDVDHIEWMIKMADEVTEGIATRRDILMPLIILHDVGYAALKERNPNPKDPRSKIAHMKEGKRIARALLRNIGYNKHCSKLISLYIGQHDRWVLGDNALYLKNIELALLNDLDFLWSLSSKKIVCLQSSAMKVPPKRAIELWAQDEKITSRPFCCGATLKLFMHLIEKRRKDFSSISSNTDCHQEACQNKQGCPSRETRAGERAEAGGK